MSEWGIKARVLFLTLAPAAIVALLLVGYFTRARLADSEAALRERGIAIARYLAPASEFGVFSGNREILQSLTQSALLVPDVVAVAIVDASGTSLASSRVTGPAEQEPPLVLNAPILRSQIHVEDMPAGDAATPQAGPIGLVIVEMSRQAILERQRRWLLGSVAIGLVCLVASAVWALSMGRSITRPISRLAETIAALGRGELDARVPVGSGGEIRVLERGVNEMAAALKAAQEDLQARIDAATRELKEQKEAAERANLAKTRFLAAASHDLRQPMQAMGLFVALLKESVSAPEQARLVSNIEAAVAAMESLLNALLDISRLDAGVMLPQVTDFPVQTLFERMRAEFAPQALEKGLRLRIRDSRAVVRTDPLMLERMLLNLISNGIRYTARGGMLVGCRRRGDRLRIEVWDTGPGIPPDQQEEIFKEFVQLSNPARAFNRGLGLGLAIVERMARLLGTEVEVRSVVGRGSVFSIMLPRGEPGASQEWGQEAREAPQELLVGKLVVIVDDDQAIVEGMREVLGRWGCQVIACASGREALAELERKGRAPDAAISDYRLAGGDLGSEVLRAIQSRFRTPVPGIVITGDTTPARIREIEAEGFHLVHKPVATAKLRALLTDLFARPAAPDKTFA